VHTVTDPITDEPHVRPEADGTPVRSSPPWRRWPSSRLERVSAAVFGVAVTLLLLPVLLAPINADERFQYFRAESRTDGSFLRLFSWTWNEIPARAAQGRVTPLGFLIQRIEYFFGLRTSVALSIPLTVVHAAARLALMVLVLWAIRSFLVRLRSRGDGGAAAGIPRERIRLVLATTALVFALGTSVEGQFRNGITTYPVLTYTALAIMIGFPAILLALLPRLATRPRWWVAGAGALVAAVLGAVLNLSYELYFVALPTMVAAVVLQYVPGAAPRTVRRVKALLLGGLTVGFGLMFAWTRAIVDAACATKTCYAGVQPKLDGPTLKTAFYNLANAIPAGGWHASEREIAAARLARFAPDWPGNELSIVVVVAGVAWGVLLLATFRRWTPVVRGERRTIGKAMLVVGGAGIGSAVLMALSAQAQTLIRDFGLPYRNTFATWGSMALGATLTVLLLALTLRGRRRAVVPFAVLVAAALVVGLYQFPLNAAVTRAQEVSSSTSLPRRIADEVTYGDRSEGADARRCALIAEIPAARVGRTTQANLAVNVAKAFRGLYGFPFCSTYTPRALMR
jgi:hypothetical protein